MIKLATTLTFLIAMLSSSLSYAAGSMEPATVCQRIATDFETVNCITAINGFFVDKKAAWACDRITTDFETVNCMKAIVGKSYQEATVDACNRITTEFETVNCFKNSGIQAQSSNCPGYREILRKVGGSLDAIDDRRMNRAKSILENLYFHLGDCARGGR